MGPFINPFLPNFSYGKSVTCMLTLDTWCFPKSLGGYVAVDKVGEAKQYSI